MQKCLLTPFTKLVKIHLRGSKAKQSHMSNFPFSFCFILIQQYEVSLSRMLNDILILDQQ